VVGRLYQSAARKIKRRAFGSHGVSVEVLKALLAGFHAWRGTQKSAGGLSAPEILLMSWEIEKRKIDPQPGSDSIQIRPP
jgi:hypothetical protein